MATIDELDIKIKAESKGLDEKLDVTIAKLKEVKKLLNSISKTGNWASGGAKSGSGTGRRTSKSTKTTVNQETQARKNELMVLKQTSRELSVIKSKVNSMSKIPLLEKKEIPLLEKRNKTLINGMAKYGKLVKGLKQSDLYNMAGPSFGSPTRRKLKLGEAPNLRSSIRRKLKYYNTDDDVSLNYQRPRLNGFVDMRAGGVWSKKKWQPNTPNVVSARLVTHRNKTSIADSFKLGNDGKNNIERAIGESLKKAYGAFKDFNFTNLFKLKETKEEEASYGMPKAHNILFSPKSKEYEDLTASLARYKDVQRKLEQEMAVLTKKGMSQTATGDKGYKETAEAVEKLKDELSELDTAIQKVNADMNKFPTKGKELKFKPFNIFRKQNSDVEGLFANGKAGNIEDDSGGSGGIGSLITALAPGAWKMLGVGLDLITSGVTNAFRKLGNVASDLFKPLSRNYKMLRLMFARTILRSIVTLTQQGFKNLIQYSDEFNASISLLWNSMRQLSNAFAAAASPIVNTFGGAINDIIQKVIEVVNKVNQMISALLGRKTWTKATALTDSYRDSLDGASGSAKELKRQLQGFDELNNITSPSSGGSGGGGGTDAKFMFTEEAIDKSWLDLSKMIKDTWNSDADFSWLGKSISDKLVEQLGKIDWEGIQEKTKKIATSIATFLNGFINPDSFGAIGTTIGEALQTAIDFAFTFVETFDWKNAGTSLASLFNNLFETVDWKELSTTISDFVAGVLDLLIQFVSDTEWSKVVGAIVDVLANIDYAKISEKIIELAGSLLEAVGEGLFGAGSSASSALSDKFKQAGFDNLGLFFDGLSDALSDIGTWLDENFSPFFDELSKTFEDYYNGEFLKICFPWLNYFENGAEDLEKTVDIGTKVKKIIENINWEELKNILKVKAVSLGASFISGFSSDSITNHVAMIGAKIPGALVGTGKNSVGDKIKEEASKFLGKIKEGFSESAVGKYFNDVKNTIINKFTGKDTKKPLSTSMSDAVKTAWTNIKNNFKTSTISSYFSNIGTVILKPFTSFAKNLKSTMTTAWNNIVTVFSKGGTAFTSITNTIGATVKDMIKKLIGGINSVVATPFNTIKNIFDTFRKWSFMGSKPFSGLPYINVPVIPTNFATGYYDLPEDGWFRAGHGEIMGKFDNGKSVIANNEHIIQGISEGVNRGIQGAQFEQNNLLREQNRLLMQILQKDTGISASDIFNAVRSENKSYYNRTGSSAFVL